MHDNLLTNKFGGDIALTSILPVEIGNHLLSFTSKSECKLHYPLSTPKIISERDQKSLRYILLINYIPNSNFLRIKKVNTPAVFLNFIVLQD